eukprot:TRINITY_DN33121_c0_g1_i1.p3 TRINITY_DN33121_c0_g1~~TRINITY_DN33121_c0_g1_i1.p3  ORF type:complete len:159 (+),score=24.27 TRINITY_DN33121_c0_g1_i1:126-602(+)
MTVGVPAAGAYRGRAYEPREVLARTGSHTMAPPHHPPAELAGPGGRSMVQIDYREAPEPCKMHLDRAVPLSHLQAAGMHELPPAGARSAGVHTSHQVARTRAEFKSHAVHGQFSNELVSSIPATRTKFQSVRCETSVCIPHQPQTSMLRAAKERAGHF